jgi:hypothetical protein
MARRLLALVLAFAVIVAPVADDICAATCARHTGHRSRNETASDNTHHHHAARAANQAAHRHESSGPANRLAVIPAPHICDHVDAVVTESREVMRGSVAKAMPATAAVTVILVRVSPSTEVDSRHGPPIPLRVTSQLRI